MQGANIVTTHTFDSFEHAINENVLYTKFYNYKNYI